MNAKSWLWTVTLFGIALLLAPTTQAYMPVSPGGTIDGPGLHCDASPQNGIVCHCETPSSAGGLVWRSEDGIGAGIGLPPTYMPCICVAVTC